MILYLAETGKTKADLTKSNGDLRNFNVEIKSTNVDLRTGNADLRAGNVDENGCKTLCKLTKSALKARSYAKTAAKTLSVSRKLLLLRADYYQEGSRMVGALRETLETL